MVRVHVHSIEKRSNDALESECEALCKQIGRYAKIELSPLFSSAIATAQNIGQNEARNAYTKTYEPLLGKGYDIALHERGELMDSNSFSRLFNGQNSKVNFFLGGAYGFEESFLARFDKVVSLSPLTMGHKIAKTVLVEQIYRGLTMLSGHPYHK